MIAKISFMIFTIMMLFTANGSVHAGYLEQRFSHDNMTMKDWKDIRDHAKITQLAVGTCNEQEQRVEKAREKAGSFFYRNGVDNGGYIPAAVVFREVRRLQEIAYISFDKIRQIKYSIREWDDPVGACKKAANNAIDGFTLIRKKFPD